MNSSPIIAALDQAIRLDPTYEPAITNRKLIESLDEGERLGREVKSVEYYKERFLKKLGGQILPFDR
jgi:hypothetical protein